MAGEYDRGRKPGRNRGVSERLKSCLEGRFWPPVVVLAMAALVAGAFVQTGLYAEEGDQPAGDKKAPPPLVAPKDWPKDHPLPQVNSNCVRCHITAGLVLTAAVRDFAHSAHDLNAMTCYDCHGGNPDDDVTAHNEEHHFIGAKLSSHLANCANCHTEEAEVLSKGPHHWDWSQRINTNYPMCIDCHGNHDVGNPPADFKLADVCLDCHDKLEKEQPEMAAVVEYNDQLWESLAKVRKRNVGREQVVPEELAKDVDSLRGETMRIIHGLGKLSPEQAKKHNEKSAELKKRLDAWLEQSR